MDSDLLSWPASSAAPSLAPPESDLSGMAQALADALSPSELQQQQRMASIQLKSNDDEGPTKCNDKKMVKYILQHHFKRFMLVAPERASLIDIRFQGLWGKPPLSKDPECDADP